MLKVVLDTNVLRENGLTKPNLVMLARLSKENVVEVYIPTIVKKEYITQRVMEINDNNQKIMHSFQAIKKHLSLENPCLGNLNDIEASFLEFNAKFEEPIKTSFERWITENNILELKFESSDIDSVIDDYFSGGGVFKKAKHRDDFPDSMISKGIISIARECPVTVLTKDGNFKEKLSKLNNVTVLNSLRQYLDTKEVAHELGILNERTSKINDVIEILSLENSQVKLAEFVCSEGAYLEDIYLSGIEVKGQENLLLDSIYDSSIEEISTSTIKNVELGDVRFVSDDVYVVDVQFSAIAQINYVGFYGDLLELEETQRLNVEFDDMNRDGYGECAETRTISFTGVIEVCIDPSLTAEQLLIHIDFFGQDNAKVSGTVEVIQGRIIDG
ncbi:PIN domain-containing protein [Shewanella colwelliana]|uniref:PIN domain-containing protein n=1 Tax=Shewanella colwelliana TaxID=23 RepID=UPI0022AFB511|nr:PIN domain-containing protein [Shewanella colwelliana]MCZ4339631.1 PIN domain-containing protein [Shewanella colwelliana]